MATIERLELDAKGKPAEVAEIRTSGGTTIYLFPVETFPGHVNNVYLIAHPDHPTLLDTGTTISNAELHRRLGEAQERFGLVMGLEDLAQGIISHAHIDHYGNARRLRELGVPIAIHELDAPVLERFHERFRDAVEELGEFLRRSGVSDRRAGRFLEMYREGKRLFSDLTPDRKLRDGDTVGPGWPTVHVPGHSPGQVCLVVDDVVLTGDHLLARTTPVQTPRSLATFCGLDRYLESLEKLGAAGPFALGLGAHEEPIEDVATRIDEVVAHHARRLDEVAGCCREEPVTVAAISRALFGRQRGYGVILALLETAAHVEHLHDHDRLVLVNPGQVADDPAAVARYIAGGT